jgi:hypothetical protein
VRLQALQRAKHHRPDRVLPKPDISCAIDISGLGRLPGRHSRDVI